MVFGMLLEVVSRVVGSVVLLLSSVVGSVLFVSTMVEEVWLEVS